MKDYIMANEITGVEDVLDSRDVIERLDELQEELDNLEAEADSAQQALDEWLEPEEPDQFDDFKHQRLTEAFVTAQQKINEWLSDYGDEYVGLKKLDEDASSYAPDWRHGEQLISEDYFETYARELAYDTGAIKDNMSWPLNHIDWEAATNALLDDYTSSEFRGTTYYYRSE
jgi:hypothetical protein